MMESEGGYTLNDVNPCPFCGNYALLKGAPQFGYFVSCQTIGCYANTSSAKHADFQAVEAWNRRATHPQPVTPAGGEVEPSLWVADALVDSCRLLGDAATVHRVMVATKPQAQYTTPLYLHPPVADAAPTLSASTTAPATPSTS